MPEVFVSRIRAVAARLRLERDWYLLIIAAGIGLVMSGVAMAFIRHPRRSHSEINQSFCVDFSIQTSTAYSC